MTFHRITLPYSVHASHYFRAIADLPWAIWLDSGGKDRYDILVAQPVATLTTHGKRTDITDAAGTRYSEADPFSLLRNALGTCCDSEPEIVFCGGAVGYWSYDLKHHNGAKTQQLPEIAVGIYDWAVQIDHLTETACLVSRLKFPETAAQLSKIAARLQQSVPPLQPFQVTGKIDSNLSRAEYAAAFTKIQDYLTAGDCYQVNLAQRFAVAAQGDALSAYLHLRELSPAPFSAFLNLPQLQILCNSPERFLQVHQRVVETKPIKGTRPRSPDLAIDEQLKQDLLNHPKDRAENLMIVDLLRNDLGKSCEVGSVKVSQLFQIESYATVHHLVSTIHARLRPTQDALSVFNDCFPGGSITGAPKQRAMEIIAQLEPHSRGVYCGAIAYLGWDGNMDSNIAIRTLTLAAGEIQFSVGGGIVADSECDSEYQETLDKAAAMFELLRHFGGI